MKPIAHPRGTKIEEQKTSREQIQEELYAEAIEYLKNFKNYDLIYEKPEKNYESRQTVDKDGLIVTINKYRAENVTEADLERYVDDRAGMIVAVVKELEGFKLPSDEGHEVDLFKMHIPFWFVSDRDLVVTFYEQYDPKTGFRNYFDSSRGNEEITKKYKKLIGKDVIVDAKLNFLQFKPYDGGMEIN